MWASLRSFDEHTRDGVRRAIPLAIGMFSCQRTLAHDSLWVFLAAFAVLLPTEKSAVRGRRGAGGQHRCRRAGLLRARPGWGAAGVLFTAAILFVLVGIAYKPTYPLQAGALSAMGAPCCSSRDRGRPGRLGRTPPARHAVGLRDGPRVDVSALAEGRTGRRRRHSRRRRVTHRASQRQTSDSRTPQNRTPCPRVRELGLW
jgi:hypothetical protein